MVEGNPQSCHTHVQRFTSEGTIHHLSNQLYMIYRQSCWSWRHSAQLIPHHNMGKYMPGSWPGVWTLSSCHDASSSTTQRSYSFGKAPLQHPYIWPFSVWFHSPCQVQWQRYHFCSVSQLSLHSELSTQLSLQLLHTELILILLSATSSLAFHLMYFYTRWRNSKLTTGQELGSSDIQSGWTWVNGHQPSLPQWPYVMWSCKWWHKGML